MDSNTQRYCVNCAHYKRVGETHFADERCYSPALPINLVSGRVKDQACSIMRMSFNPGVTKNCGVEGKWYMSKLSPTFVAQSLPSLEKGA